MTTVKLRNSGEGEKEILHLKWRQWTVTGTALPQVMYAVPKSSESAHINSHRHAIDVSVIKIGRMHVFLCHWRRKLSLSSDESHLLYCNATR